MIFSACSLFINLYKLSCRLHYQKRSYDPIDYECIDKSDFWIIEEKEPPELDYEELMEAHAVYQKYVIPINDPSKHVCAQG